MGITFGAVIPVLRIFDIDKARAFYVDYLGFEVVWEHRFSPSAPLYMEVRRAGLRLHLSEHHGDGSPGVQVRIETSGLRDYHAELHGKAYGYLRPGLEPGHGGVELGLLDPFGNRLTLYEPEGDQ
ncbi:glyoxalase superfamily protein [Caulobacter mirabilis]|uniref:Bleomycin resistance protein n=1 Tax=Caulobacter mirabilis TaxID=69666 RepID=A0A2D2ATU0_9CAUL|nr:glyoxalase superfamily protein [Caulobacter mirabilis]ATQ41428.1 glyoxalase/bleomycin resistance/extradiol dioxygenase family protein [Caulobacter mirabilis]